MLVAHERAEAAQRDTFIMQLEYYAKTREREPRQRSGFWLQRDWYGTGVISNKQHRFPSVRRLGTV